MKVLVSAYACEPDKGSEPGVGWNWVKQITRFHEVWVITRANNREPIERALKQEPLPNVHWVYFDLPYWARFWKRGPIGLELYYQIWHILIYFLARRLHNEVKFDIVHHVTFGRYWVPSFLSYLPTTFVWGPVGGGEVSPARFYNTYSLRGRVYEATRAFIRLASSVSPLLHLAARRASISLAATRQTARRLERLKANNIVVHPQVFLTRDQISYFQNFPVRSGRHIRFLSMGRLVHWKGYHLSLRAYARFYASYPDSEYWLVNDGPERQTLEKLARDLGISNKVRFWGKLPTLPDVYDKLAQCDVLLHPALHEAFGVACLEALAAGRPVICFDWGGPALQVTQESGFKVPPHTPEQSIHDFANAMLKLASQPELRAQMGLEAQRRVRTHFSWESKGDQICEMYEQVISR